MIFYVSKEYSPSSVGLLKSSLPDAQIKIFHPKEALPDDFKDSSGLLIRSSFTVHNALLKEMSKLKWLVTSTSGFDHIDLKACSNYGVQVSYTPEGNVQSVVELTTYFILELQHQFAHQQNMLKNFQWKDQLNKSHEVKEKTLGIIGFGRIGREVCRVSQAIGLNVIVCDPYVDPILIEERNAESVGLSEILRMSDFLTLHVPLTNKTRGMINEKTLELMQSSSFLINTSRGNVVKEVALIEALKNKTIAGAALDVFSSEPLPRESSLRDLDNLIMTPHSGAYTQEAFERVSRQAVEQTIAYFSEGKNAAPLPPNASWYED
ncbi:MAG: NAD(P)-dependent oxidoreductase [Bdellovibrionales bacterium]